MDHTKSEEGGAVSPATLTRDDAARISASVVNAVLEKLNIRHIVEGIAVLPAGEKIYLVDIIMRDLANGGTWAVSVTIPPQEETDERD
jgi:hypothetical protein